MVMMWSKIKANLSFGQVVFTCFFGHVSGKVTFLDRITDVPIYIRVT